MSTNHTTNCISIGSRKIKNKKKTFFIFGLGCKGEKKMKAKTMNMEKELENVYLQFQCIAEEPTSSKMHWLFEKLSKEVMECE